MKLALIRRQFSAMGGAELYLQRLLGGLAGAGHEVHLYAEAWDAAPAGVQVHAQQVTGSRAARPRAFAEAVRQAVAREPFDCIFSLERTLRQDVYRAGDGLHRMWLRRRRQFAPWWRKPLVGWGAFHRSMQALETQTFDPGNTSHIIVNSEMVRREILEHFQFPAGRIHLVRNGVDVTRLQTGRRAETRARFGIKEGEFLLLFVGSGWERKGLRYLLAALRQLPAENLKLLIVGKGAKPSLPPGNAIFAGTMNDVENAYAAADLFTFLPIYEPSANVCFEALAAGLPVVTTALNGAAELVRERVNGSVVSSPADIGAVVEAIRYWRSRAERRPALDTPALSLERNVAETVAVLEMAARGRAK
jgi:UDP-glucose:(heptosyl)LPS alpha-1,3-glucosyltransferase